MKKKFGLLIGLCLILLVSGCSNRSDETVVTKSPEYVLADFNQNNLQEIKNHGISLMVPAIWETSVDENSDGTFITLNYDYGVMTVLGYHSENELNFDDYVSDYTSTYSYEAIIERREELLDNQRSEVIYWTDEANGNKIHGTTYLFIFREWYYNITLSTYAEVSYEQELLNIMDTFEFDESDIDEIPLHITELFHQYQSIILSGNYDISLSEKIGVDDSDKDCTYYRISLCPSDPDIITYPCVEFYSDNEYTDKSFSIDSLEHCPNSAVKEIIFCTLAATNPNLELDRISEMQAELVNSYDGYNQSKVVESEFYKYYIATEPHFNSMTLKVIAKEEINTPVEIELYSEYSINEMQAELNKGTKAIVKGIVEYEEFDWITNTLRITNGSNKYYVHYNPESFPGEFSEGNEYIFYGTICEECDSNSGCLHLDYYELFDDSYIETDDSKDIVSEESIDISKIDVTFSKDYIDGDRLYLKVYVENTSDKTFTGDIHVFFYSADGKDRLGSDMIIVEELAPGRESWANVIIDKYDGMPKLELEFSNPTFTDIETITVSIDTTATEKTKNSYYLNFDGVSWYNDVTDIVVYEDGNCVVTVKNETKEDGQFYAATIWSCGNDHGVESVQVVDSNGTIQSVYP